MLFLISLSWNLSEYITEPLYNKSFQYVNEYNQDINISSYWNTTKTLELRMSVISEKAAESSEIEYSNYYEKDSKYIQTTLATIMAAGKVNGNLSVGVNPIFKEINLVEFDFTSNSSFDKKIKSLQINDLNDIVLIPSEKFYYEPIEKFINTDRTFENVNPKSVFFSAAGDNGERGYDAASIIHNNFREVGIITASTKYGKHASYSQHSSMVLLNAPVSGVDFYNSTGNENKLPGMTESDFIQTSGAAGIAAGLASIVHNKFNAETNEQLFTRMALTASVNDPTDNLWIKNAANIYHSPLYGFGRPRSYSLGPSAKYLGISNISKHDLLPKPLFGSSTQYSIPYGSSFPREIEFNVSTAFDSVLTLQVHVTPRYAFEDDLRIDVTSPSNTTVRIFKGNKGPGHINPSSSAGQSKKYTFGTRAFLGEKANGIWKVKVMHMCHMPLDAASFFIEIGGFNTNGLNPRQLNSTIPINKAKIDLMSNNFTCLSNVTIKAPKITSRSPIYLTQVGGDGGKYQIGTIEPEETRNITVPCLFEPSLKYHLLIEAPDPNNKGAFIQYESDDLTIQNPYEYPQVINHENYVSFAQGKNYTISYARRGKIHNHNTQFAMVGIYDQHKRNIRLLDSIPDTGSFSLNFEKDEAIMYRPVLSIQTYDADDTECPVIFPFHFYSREESSVIKNYPFDVYVDKDRCPYLKNDPFWTAEVRRLDLPVEANRRTYKQGFLMPFSTIGLTLVSSIIYYFVVGRKKIDLEIDKELGGSFVP